MSTGDRDNLEEPFAKVVGTRTNRNPAAAYDAMIARVKSFARPLPYPKGVYRFKTFEEADAWSEKYRLQEAASNFSTHASQAVQPLPKTHWFRKLLNRFRKSS
jgi:hypothetical protein